MGRTLLWSVRKVESLNSLASAFEGIGGNVEAGGPVHNGETAADESRFAEVARFRVCPREGQYGIQVPKGVWHTVVVLEPTTILESKDGTYGK